MVPAQTPLSKTAAASKSRLSCIYVPHGATMDKWTPAADGKAFEFTEILGPLEKFRDRVSIVSNLAHPAAGGVGSDAGADHARSAAVFLSGVHPETGLDSRRHHNRPDRGAAHRSGYPAAFDRAVDRRGRSELRLRLRLRLLEYDFLEDADHPSADGEQSAGGVRKTVRRREQQRRPAGAQAAEPQPARFGHGSGGVLTERPAGVRPHQAGRVSRRRPGDRAAHPESPEPDSRRI